MECVMIAIHREPQDCIEGKCYFCGLCEDICSKDAIRLTKNFFLSTFDNANVIKYPTLTTE